MVYDTLVEGLVDSCHLRHHYVVEVGVRGVDFANFADLCLGDHRAHVLACKDGVSSSFILNCVHGRAAQPLHVLLVIGDNRLSVEAVGLLEGVCPDY